VTNYERNIAIGFIVVVSALLFLLTRAPHTPAKSEISENIDTSKYSAASIPVYGKEDTLSNAEMDSLLKPLVKTVDDVWNAAFYQHKNAKQYIFNGILDQGYADLYFRRDLASNVFDLRFKIQYDAVDWLFVRSYYFKCDSQTFHFYPSKVSRDNKGTIWEWSDDIVDGQLDSILQGIIKSKSTKLRFVGDNYYADRVLSHAEVSAISDIYQRYVALTRFKKRPAF
jgi:hypothetical protein